MSEPIERQGRVKLSFEQRSRILSKNQIVPLKPLRPGTKALGIKVGSVRRRQRMLDGICPDAADILRDTDCPLNVFDTLRRMMPLRQIEAAKLMVGQNNFTGVFAKALLAATPEKLLVQPRKSRPGTDKSVSGEQIARMERELASLQTQVKSVEETYGIDNLHLTVALGYVRKVQGNARVTHWLSQHRQEYLTEFQTIAEIETLGSVKVAAEWCLEGPDP